MSEHEQIQKDPEEGEAAEKKENFVDNSGHLIRRAGGNSFSEEFEEYVHGFVEAAGDFLTGKEPDKKENSSGK